MLIRAQTSILFQSRAIQQSLTRKNRFYELPDDRDVKGGWGVKGC